TAPIGRSARISDVAALFMSLPLEGAARLVRHGLDLIQVHDLNLEESVDRAVEQAPRPDLQLPRFERSHPLRRGRRWGEGSRELRFLPASDSYLSLKPVPSEELPLKGLREGPVGHQEVGVELSAR